MLLFPYVLISANENSIDVVDVCPGHFMIEQTVCSGQVWKREELQDILHRWIDASCRDAIVLKGFANVSSRIRRVRGTRRRIVDRGEMPGSAKGLREITLPFKVCRNGINDGLRSVLTDSFIVEEEKRMIAAVVEVRKNDRPSDGDTELIA